MLSLTRQPLTNRSLLSQFEPHLPLVLHVLAKLESRTEVAGPLRDAFVRIVKALSANPALQTAAAQLPPDEQASLQKYLQ